ncbi:MAG: FAD-dependent oxidoreductase [Gammaproteobacteria bacterium]|nr:FAD-dependent oxidoreductase [Gammaproteobacteria bacterium]
MSGRRVAVVGAGIAGLLAAHRLSGSHEVTVFEAEPRIGGHTHTVEVEAGGEIHAVDTGFIVFNDWTYPNFVALLAELGVASQPSSMSFSVRCERSGLEYNGTSLDALFAQRSNLLSPGFLGMVAGILRFNRRAPELLRSADLDLTLGAYLAAGGYSRRFVEHYVVPMGAAIWSSRPADVLEFPARFFVEFFANHGFLSVDDRPVWRVVRGGSREYLHALTAPFAARIRTATPVESLLRERDGVALRLRDGSVERFDALFLACHSDQALRLLADPSPAEREVLGAIGYQANEVLLHTDTRLMPRRRRAWAAWNYHLPKGGSDRVAVTYDMNILQSLRAPVEFLVTLNRAEAVDPATVLGRYLYHHPVYTRAAVAAQGRRAEVSGQRHTYYCGAYWGYGFHEDGVNSALAALEEFRRAETTGQDDAQPHLQRVG